MTQKNVIVLDEAAQQEALKYARGRYQRGIILGYYCLSGADLRGKAREYSDRYARSRENLMHRLEAAGVDVREVKGRNNKRILVFGSSQ